MKSMEQLEKNYEKELRLVEQHKKNAADIRKQMDMQMGKVVGQKINSLNMSGVEYDRFIKLLSSGKKTVLEAVELVLGETAEKKGDESGEAS